MTNRLGLTQQELSSLASRGQAHFHQLHVHGICRVGGDQPDRQGNARGRYRLRGHRVRGDKCTQLTRTDSGETYFLTGGLCEEEYLIGRLRIALKSR